MSEIENEKIKPENTNVFISISPSGYVYGGDPAKATPFWSEDGDTPQPAGNYVKSVEFSESETDDTKTYTETVTDSNGNVTQQNVEVPKAAPVTSGVKSVELAESEDDDNTYYIEDVTDADGTQHTQTVIVPKTKDLVVTTEGSKTGADYLNVEAGGGSLHLSIDTGIYPQSSGHYYTRRYFINGQGNGDTVQHADSSDEKIPNEIMSGINVPVTKQYGKTTVHAKKYWYTNAGELTYSDSSTTLGHFGSSASLTTPYYDIDFGSGPAHLYFGKSLKFNGDGTVSVLSPFDGSTVEQTVTIGGGSGGSSLQWTDTAWLTCNYYGSDGAVVGDQVKMNITVTQGETSYSGVAYAKLQSVSPVQLATIPCVYVLTNNADITDQHLIVQSGTYINMTWDSSTSAYTGSYGLRELSNSTTSPLAGAFFGVYCEKISSGTSGVTAVIPTVTVENISDGSSSEYMLQKTSVSVDVDGVAGTAEASIKTPARVVTGVTSVGKFDYGTTCYLEAKTTMGGTVEWQDDNETSPLITPKGDSDTVYTDLLIGQGGSIKTQKPLKFDGAGNVQVLNPFDGETVEQTISLGGGSGGSGLPTPLTVTLKSLSGQMITSSGVGMLTIQLWNASSPTDGLTTDIPVPYCYNGGVGDINATTLFSGFSMAGETVNFLLNVRGEIFDSNTDLTLKIYRYTGGSTWTADTFDGNSYWEWTPGV